MGDITRPEQTEMLKQCYVEDQQLNEFSRDLQRILQYDAALDERKLPIEPLDEQALMQALELQTASSNPKTILLVGNIGAGKSTFVHRFIRYTARPQQHICVVIDLINDSAVEINYDRAEERRLAQSVLDKLATEFRGTVDPYSYEVIRSCFESEVARFKKLHKVLFEHDPTQYRLQEDAYVFELVKDAYKHLIGYVKYIRHKKRKVFANHQFLVFRFL